MFTPHYFDAAHGPDTAPLEAMLAQPEGRGREGRAFVEASAGGIGKTTVPHDHKFCSEDHLARKHHPFLPGGFADTDSRARSVAWLKTYL